MNKYEWLYYFIWHGRKVGLTPGTPGPLRPLEPPGLLEPPRPLGPPVPQDPMDSRDPQDLWTLRHPGTSGPQNPWEITSTV